MEKPQAAHIIQSYSHMLSKSTISTIGKAFDTNFKRCTTNLTTDGYAVDACYTCSDSYKLSLIMYYLNNEVCHCFIMGYSMVYTRRFLFNINLPIIEVPDNLEKLLKEFIDDW